MAFQEPPVLIIVSTLLVFNQLKIWSTTF